MDIGKKLFDFLQRVLPSSCIYMEHCDYIAYRVFGITIYKEYLR